MKIILLSLILFFSLNSYAQETYDCSVEKEKIFTDLKKDIECSNDDECSWFDYGYPWQPSACMKAIINTTKESHNITTLRLIEEYNNHCIYQNKDENKKHDDFAAELKKGSCNIPRTYCYKGFCRIKDYATYNDQ